MHSGDRSNPAVEGSFDLNGGPAVVFVCAARVGRDKPKVFNADLLNAVGYFGFEDRSTAVREVDGIDNGNIDDEGISSNGRNSALMGDGIGCCRPAILGHV